MHYHHKMDLNTIFNYPIEQTGQVTKTDFFMQWAKYLDLVKEYGVANKIPKRFIVDYNFMLEKAGKKPVIYEIEGRPFTEFIERTGNVISVVGTFPCDETGKPIMRWIGLEVNNPTRIWVQINERSQGCLYIEVNPKTSVFGLNCWGKHDDGSDCWYRLYIGPQLMEFDYKQLKEVRKREG